MQRRLVHPSGKFWEIERTGHRLRVRWGQVGGPAQQRDMEGDDAKVEGQIARQQALGFVEAAADESVLAVLATAEPEKPWYRRFEGGGRFLSLRGEKTHLQITEGAIDDEGLSYVDKLGSFKNVIKSAAEQISVALHAGMVLVSEVEPPPKQAPLSHGPALATNPELEAMCVAALDDPAPWAVYADWLMAHGDPRGEIAALRVRAEIAAADAKLDEAKVLLYGNRTSNENKHGEYDTSNADFLSAVNVTAWRHGFPHAIQIHRTDPDSPLSLDTTTKRFLALPTAVFVDEISFGLAGYPYDNNWRSTIDAVAKSPIAARIRSLRFDAYDVEANELSGASFGDFSRAWAKLQELEHLWIASGKGGVLGKIDLPNLRSFVRIAGELGKNEIAAVAAASWPQLEHLEIWFGEGQGTPAQLAPILAGTKLPKLRRLGLSRCEYLEELVDALATSKLLPRLQTLDLTWNAFDPAMILEHVDRFAHLDAIEITATGIPDPDLHELQMRVRIVEHPDDDERSRYVNVGE